MDDETREWMDAPMGPPRAAPAFHDPATVPPRFTMEAWPTGTRERALRHALRYRKAAQIEGRANLFNVKAWREEVRRNAQARAYIGVLIDERERTRAALNGYPDSDLVSLAQTITARLKALEEVVWAARRYAELDGLRCEYVDGAPDVCPGVERVGGPCHWCDLRATLEAVGASNA